MKKSSFFDTPVWSWDIPLEQELLKWARYMKQQNLTYIRITIWGRKQQREAQIYAHAFEMIEEKILKEIAIRNDTSDNPS